MNGCEMKTHILGLGPSTTLSCVGYFQGDTLMSHVTLLHENILQ